LGAHIEADVAEFENRDVPGPEGNGAGGVAVQVWAPPQATFTMPAVFPDTFEVQVFDTAPGGARLVAAVELVSPGNKDRAEKRSAFAEKCGAYLQSGVGLIVIDIVTTRHGNLHNDLVSQMGLSEHFAMAADTAISAVAYRPIRREVDNAIDVWVAPLAVGAPLPLLPLALLGNGCIPLDLEATYSDARQRSGLS
jgi:hypothetical protein